jgi:predicted small integral membrane protein
LIQPGKMRIRRISLAPPNVAISMIVRLTKIAMSLALAAYVFLVTFDNITDYGSNYAFVEHVLSMDTTFPGNELMYRLVSNHDMWTVFYWLIIAGEGVTFVFLALGSYALWRARRARGTGFNAAKALVIAGCGCGFIVWFFGFMVVGGEWFAMWQSKIWNGQEAAFRLYAAVLGLVIFINQRDEDLA